MPVTLRRRFGAMVYDSLLVIALWLVTLFLLVILNGGEAVPSSITQPIAVIELFGFFAYFWLHRGQTLGMLAWRIRLVSADPNELAIVPRQVLLRFVGACLAFASFGLGYVWQLIDNERRALPDLISKTRLVFEPKN